jgi:4-hydroxy-tetrahydrodipicolinate reductase
MKIALIGYGKMGQAIEIIAREKEHEIVLIIDLNNQTELNTTKLLQADVAIEFTNPDSAESNIKACLDAGIPVLSGSTGWTERLHEVKEYCLEKKGTFLYASNFSIGVNLFFELNRKLAVIMKNHDEYDVKMEEIHHTQKKDAPSGTAITLAEDIIHQISSKKKWVNEPSDNKKELSIISNRVDPAPGTHKIIYTSSVDDIEIVHTAHNRTGFASGAVMAAEFIHNKKGIYTMQDVLKLG